MTYLFVSTDLNTGTSGDIVATQELNAMSQLAHENKEEISTLAYDDIHPNSWRLPDFPFFIDALALYKISHMDLSSKNIKLVHFYGGCYPQTMRYLKSKNIRTTITSMMHNRDISIQEHEDMYGKRSFPFNHIADYHLYNQYIGAIREAYIVITGGTAPKLLLEKEGARRVEIIPHGTHIPDESKILPFPDEFRCGYIGKYGPDKGIKYLIQGWSKLGYKDSRLIFAGPESIKLRDYINRHSNYSGLTISDNYGEFFRQEKDKTAYYYLMGYVNDLANFYNQISVYCQPSATEGFGIETIEAMSYGRPVIVSSGAGSADCVIDNETGFIVPTRDPDAIAERIDYLKKHNDQLHRMSDNCKKVAKEYDWSIIRQKYINLWNDLISHSSSENSEKEVR